MVRSAGIAVVWEDKVLLVHPTLGTETGCWGIPKGRIEEGETLSIAALREFWEETSLKISEDLLEGPYEIDYTRPSNNRVYKKIYYFICKIESLQELGIKGNDIPRHLLQKSEVDKACFVKLETAKELLFWRMLPLIDQIKES